MDEAIKTKQSPVILLNSEGRAWTQDGFRASWGKACKRANIEEVTFNDLRGTAVTRLAWSAARNQRSPPSPAIVSVTCARSSMHTTYTAIRHSPRAPFASSKWVTRKASQGQNRNRIYKMTYKTVYRVLQQKEEKANEINWLGN